MIFFTLKLLISVIYTLGLVIGQAKKAGLVIGHFNFFFVYLASKLKFYLVYPMRWIDVNNIMH
jgi:hypothetical protein